MKLGPHSFNLRPFEASASTVSFDIRVDVVCQGTDLQVVFHLKGPLVHLKLAPVKLESRFVPELWKSTCFEVFLKKPASAQYMEWNFSSNRDWWACYFDDYRKSSGSNERQFAAPKILEEINEAEMRLTVKILRPLDYELMGLAVILDHIDSKTKSYWSLDHFEKKPDFHDFRSFLIELG